MYHKLVKEMRESISPQLSGDNPLDKLMLTLEPVIVERFYPKQYKARCILRNSYNNPEQDAFICDIGLLGLTDKIRILTIPKKKSEEICPYTGMESIIPEDYIIGLILAVSGDINRNGGILIMYTNLYDSEDFPTDIDGEVYLANDESEIRIKENRIDITTPNLYINGELYE